MSLADIFDFPRCLDSEMPADGFVLFCFRIIGQELVAAIFTNRHGHLGGELNCASTCPVDEWLRLSPNAQACGAALTTCTRLVFFFIELLISVAAHKFADVE
jgi:hypothetical protein